MFYNASGHTTATCFDLKDEIEFFIRRGKLTSYHKDVDCGTRNSSNREIEGEIQTITGGPYIRGQCQRSMKSYAREVRQKPSGGVFQVVKETLRPTRGGTNELSFTDADVDCV